MLSRRSPSSSKVSGFALCVCLISLAQVFVGPIALAQEKKAEVKKAALNDVPVGSKSTEDLMRRLSKSYDTHNDALYLSLFKTSLVKKLRMQIQFDRDSKKIARNFRYVTVAQEKARLAGHTPAPAGLSEKAKSGDKTSALPLPVAGYVNFDLKTSPEAPPDVIGLPVGQSKELYYLMAL